MPLPGENKSRASGTYTLDNDQSRASGTYTLEDQNDTPVKPAPLAITQVGGTMPRGDTDQNRNRYAKQDRLPTRDEAVAALESLIRTMFISGIVLIAIIIILALVLSLAICLGTDLCSSSSSATAQASKGNRTYQARLGATLTAPVIPEPGKAPFDEFLNTTLKNLTASIHNESTSVPSTTISVHRSRRHVDSVNHTLINRFSPIDHHVMDKIRPLLLQSIKSSSLCREIDCSDLIFSDFRLDNDVLRSRFSLNIGSDQPLSIDPISIQEITAITVSNFSNLFIDVFPGYRLGQVDLAFDLMEFCNYTAIYCVNFTNINDTIPTPPTTTQQTTTIPDRSDLLPQNDTFQLFNWTTDTQSNSVSIRSTFSTSSIWTTKLTSTVVPILPNGMADCSHYGFPCAKQNVRVSTRERCDGVIQCPDGSDEQFCEACRTSFMCPNGDGSWMCLRGKVVCDGKSSCPTDFDEGPVHCKTVCLASEYRCRNSKACIPKRWLCDGDVQCAQGDDEMECNIPSKCNNNAFLCAADHRCIGAWATCNGVWDCSDGADEARCTCLDCSGDRTALCSAPNGKCILKTQICDGKKDCPNGEDEQKCPP